MQTEPTDFILKAESVRYLPANATVVVTADHELTMEEAARIKAKLSEIINREVVVLSGGLRLEIIDSESDDAR